ncbi:MAG: LysM peptidoglycan-binding domain-containing protein [Elusimicrobiota bacterium]
MAGRITRLQIIFLTVTFFLVFNICSRFYRAWQIASRRTPTIPPITAIQEEPIQTQEEDIETQRLKKLELKARQQIAVSGEKIKLKKKDRFDVSSATLLLKKAKNYYALADYENALLYARDASNAVDTLVIKKLPEPKLYIVKKNDTLWYIAKKHFRKGSKWYNIWIANKETIPDFDKIYCKQKIIIPELKQKKQS